MVKLQIIDILKFVSLRGGDETLKSVKGTCAKLTRLVEKCHKQAQFFSLFLSLSFCVLSNWHCLLMSTWGFSSS